MSGTNPEVAAPGVLARREIEAAMIGPLVTAFRERFGDDAVMPLLAEVIERLARDHGAALARGFSPDVELTRTQTIMEGAPFCDFRYRGKSEG